MTSPLKIKPFPCIVTVALFCLIPFSLTADVDFPLVQAFTVFPFLDDETADRDRFHLTLQTRYSNIYSLDFEKTGVNDFEMASFSLALRYGLIEGLTLELYYRYLFVYGGFLDGGIEAFHIFFGLPSARRDHYPCNGIHYYYQDYFNYSQATGTSSPLVFSLLKRFAKSRNFNLAGRLFVGIPLLSKPGFVSDKVYWGMGLIARGNWKDFSIHSIVQVSYIRTPEWIQPESLRSLLLYLKMELNYKRFLAGFILKTSPFKSGYFSSNAHLVYAGYKISDRIEIGITEDLPPLDTTPDVGFYCRYNIL